MFVARHRLAWDLRGIADKTHRALVQDALNQCAAKFSRVRQSTKQRIPCTVSDLSRHNAALTKAHGHHVHVHDEDGNEGHLLGEPTPAGSRSQALGLFWLPTSEHKAGRVELDASVMGDKPLAQEVFLAEAAHAYDYGALTDAQRIQIMGLFDFSGRGAAPEGWFEERGEDVYWRWRGERWMGLFMAAFAPGLPRPLEPRQPWQWSYDVQDIATVRGLLR